MAAGLSSSQLAECEDSSLRLQLKCGHQELNRWRSRTGGEFAQSVEVEKRKE
jgi:hypothetical protein